MFYIHHPLCVETPTNVHPFFFQSSFPSSILTKGLFPIVQRRFHSEREMVDLGSTSVHPSRPYHLPVKIYINLGSSRVYGRKYVIHIFCWLDVLNNFFFRAKLCWAVEWLFNGCDVTPAQLLHHLLFISAVCNFPPHQKVGQQSHFTRTTITFHEDNNHIPRGQQSHFTRTTITFHEDVEFC